jgi:hypothetical protein
MGLFDDDEPREPSGTYQVWHKEADGFQHVANVECANLLGALVLPYLPSQSQRVTQMVTELRSFRPGDVIVNPERVAYEIYEPDIGGTAFRQIDFCQEQFKVILAGDIQKYETHLHEATERALDRMQGKGREL